MGRKIVILLGQPGAGKGTQSRAIMKQLSIPQISTGDMLRDAVSRQTPAGIAAKQKMDAGELVSDDIVNGIVAERIELDDCQNGFILDGYPRNEQQAETLNKINEALARLEGGRYGFCYECGEEISEARLRALPFAVRCKDCEEARENAVNRERMLSQRRGSNSLFYDLQG